jgi:hypothetical protein
MDLPGVRFNMASERILIEHNLFETVPTLHFLHATLRSHVRQGAGVSIGSEMSGSVRDIIIRHNLFTASQCVHVVLLGVLQPFMPLAPHVCRQIRFQCENWPRQGRRSEGCFICTQHRCTRNLRSNVAINQKKKNLF